MSLPRIPDLNQLRIERAKLKTSALALRTMEGYDYDWSMFESWCASVSCAALPASTDTISLYLTDLLTQGKKVTTARRRAASISYRHRQEGLPFAGKELRELLSSAARIRSEMPRQMRALSVLDLRTLAAAYLRDGSPVALRNRSVVTLGFASALRRSSLARLEIRDLEFTGDGLILTLRNEKWNRDGTPRLVGVPRGRAPASCPVTALKDWLGQRGGDAGKVYTHVDGAKGRGLSDQTFHAIVSQGLALIGIDPEYFGSHSLRAGFVTAAGEGGASELLIAGTTGHRSMRSLRGYFRRTDLFRANACSLIGL
jgi:site-specific recombinase XerD